MEQKASQKRHRKLFTHKKRKRNFIPKESLTKAQRKRGTISKEASNAICLSNIMEIMRKNTNIKARVGQETIVRILVCAIVKKFELYSKCKGDHQMIFKRKMQVSNFCFKRVAICKTERYKSGDLQLRHDGFLMPS